VGRANEQPMYSYVYENSTGPWPAVRHSSNAPILSLDKLLWSIVVRTKQQGYEEQKKMFHLKKA
jgi:hypothetical protein